MFTLAEREEISRGIAAKQSIRWLLDRSSTISREIPNGGLKFSSGESSMG